MDNLIGRYRNITILGATIIFQVIGLAIQVKRSTENRSDRLIRVWAVSAITPLEKAIVSVQSGAADVWHNYFYLRGVRQENRQLKEQIEQLQLEQVRLQQDANQAHRLQALLSFKEQFIAKTLAAQVIGSSGSEQSRTVYIDKGSRDGVQQDMAVISAAGVVGKVIAVYKSASQVMLINDHDSGVGAIFEESRLQSTLKGNVAGELVADKIMSDEDVKMGDKVVTSGGDLIFPKGLMIGTVAKIKKGPEFFEVTVKPATALNRLEEVLVITRKEEREPIAPGTSTRAADILAQRLPSVPDKPVTPSGTPANGVAPHPAVPANANAHLLSPNGGSQNASPANPAAPLKTAAPGNVSTLKPASVQDGMPGNSSAAAQKSTAVPAATSRTNNSTTTAKLPAVSNAAKPVANTPPPEPDSTGDAPQ